MRGEKDTLSGGFDNPSDGWHFFEIDSEVNFMEDATTKEATKVLVMFFSVIDDEVEEGRRVRQGFDLGTPKGKEALAALLYWCDLAPKIEQNLKLEDGPELSELLWGNKYLDPDTAIGAKVIRAVFQKGPKRKFAGKTQERKGTGKDKTGQSVDRMYCNLIKLRKYGDKEVLAEIKKQRKGEPPAAAKSQTETGIAPEPEATEENWN